MDLATKLVQSIASKAAPGFTLVQGRVLEVTEDTVQLMPFGSSVPVVASLRHNQASTGISIVPMIGTEVVCMALDSSRYLLLYASEVASISIDGQVVLNGGQQQGVPLVLPLVQVLNQLIASLKELQTLFNTHTHAIPDGVTAVPAIVATTSLAAVDATQIANPKVLQ